MATVQAGTPPTGADLSEHVRDTVASFVVGGEGIAAVHSDGGDTLTLHAAPLDIWLAIAGTAYTNLPAAITVLSNAHQHRVDLSRMTEVRCTVRTSVAANAGAVFRAQYSLDGVAWEELSATLANAAIDAVAHVVSPWRALAAGAQADVYLRPVTEGGDGAADPVIHRPTVQFR